VVTPVSMLIVSVVTLSVCVGGSGDGAAAAQRSSSVAGPSPYIRDGFERGLGTPWNETPEDRSRLFRLVRGYRSAKALALVVTPNSYGPVAGSEMTAAWFHSDLAHAGRGAETSMDTWYHVRVRFPRGRYKPTRGDWNWLVVWHNDTRTSSFDHAHSIAMGVLTDYTKAPAEAAPGRRPRLFLRLLGGDVTAPQSYTVTLRANSLRYNHWYDILFHFVWSPDPKVGLAEWWVDHKPKASVAFPTLYTLPDGSHSYNGFGLYNYRQHAPWTSEVDFDDVALGPDRASVRG
jgi:Polysaccharide lyase